MAGINFCDCICGGSPGIPCGNCALENGIASMCYRASFSWFATCPCSAAGGLTPVGTINGASFILWNEGTCAWAYREAMWAGMIGEGRRAFDNQIVCQGPVRATFGGIQILLNRNFGAWTISVSGPMARHTDDGSNQAFGSNSLMPVPPGIANPSCAAPVTFLPNGVCSSTSGNWTSGGQILLEPIACPVPAQLCPAPNTCAACPPTLTAVISNSGTISGLPGAPGQFDGSYVLTRQGNSCLWLDPILGSVLSCNGTRWYYQHGGVQQIRWSAWNTTGCPPSSGWLCAETRTRNGNPTLSMSGGGPGVAMGGLGAPFPIPADWDPEAERRRLLNGGCCGAPSAGWPTA